MPARQRIHECVLERVPHVQRASDVRRRQRDAVRLAVTARCESSGSFPTFVDPALDVAGSVGLVHEGPGLYGGRKGGSPHFPAKGVSPRRLTPFARKWGLPPFSPFFTSATPRNC